MAMQKETTVTIEGIGSLGEGMGRLDGKPVYVGKTAPGDSVRVGMNGRLLQVVTPGPERVEAPCPYFETCGSCSLQHVSEEFYRGWKIQKVKDAFSREGVSVEKFEEPVFLPAATRRRATFAAIKTQRGVLFGYTQAKSHQILDVQACLVLEPALDQKFQALREFLPALLPAGKSIDIGIQYVDGVFDLMLTGPLQQGGKFNLEQLEIFAEIAEKLGIARVSWAAKENGAIETLLMRDTIFKKFGVLKVALAPGAFLQASIASENALVKIVQKYAKGAQHIADLFCGYGTFAGNLLQQDVKIHAAENDNGAVKALQKAAPKNLSVEKRNLFKNPLTQLDDFDTVIFDPPRAGAGAQSAALAYSNVPRIIGVSCNPVSFARDAKILQEGGYSLKSVTLVDQFVWSAHVEVVGLFEK
jgi:23S rRNA (uracil1939-C5)-methyltransferase